MKRIMLAGMLALMPVLVAARPVAITIANRAIPATAIIEHGQVLLPLRATFEGLNSTVSYDSRLRIVAVHNILHWASVRIGSRSAVLDGRIVDLNSPARIIGGQIYVPLQFAAEAMGAIIRYDAKDNTVAVNGSEPKASGNIDINNAPAEINPPPNTSVETAYPIVSASLGSAIAASNAVSLAIDGINVTSQASFDGRTITYVPTQGLAPGRHTARFSARTATGRRVSTQWSFETTSPPMGTSPSYAFGDLQFYGQSAYSYPGGSVVNFTLIGPPTGSGFIQLCGARYQYPLWNAGGRYYRARVALPKAYFAGACPITAIYVGRHGRRLYVPLSPAGSGLYITGNPINPLGQLNTSPIFVPVLPTHPHRRP